VWHTGNLLKHCRSPSLKRLVVADGRQPVAKVGKARREGGTDVAASLLNYGQFQELALLFVSFHLGQPGFGFLLACLRSLVSLAAALWPRAQKFNVTLHRVAQLYPTAEEARITCAIVDAAARVRDLNFKYLAEGEGATVTARFGKDGITICDPNRASERKQFPISNLGERSGADFDFCPAASFPSPQS